MEITELSQNREKIQHPPSPQSVIRGCYWGGGGASLLRVFIEREKLSTLEKGTSPKRGPELLLLVHIVKDRTGKKESSALKERF